MRNKNAQPWPDPAAFSPDGYIISQEHTAGVPYGVHSSDYNGCGWIAAYNLLRALGRPAKPLAAAKSLAASSPFHGSLGTGPLRLARWLRRRGIPVQTARKRPDVLRLAGRSRAGILFYFDDKEPHYVAFINQGGGVQRFLNAVDGAAMDTLPMAAFLDNRAAGPIYYLMAVV